MHSAQDDSDWRAPTQRESSAPSELRRLVYEEQSLRNVAMIVATAGPRDDILTAICREASNQLEGQEVTLFRFESNDSVVAVATHNGPIPPGVRATHDAGSLMDLVAKSGAPVRVDDFEGHSDAHLVSPFGIRAAVAVPVFVEGEVWGMFSASSQVGPLPDHIESRLAGFAQLTWAAVANTEARDSLRRMAEEQAALRRVAELVARESPLSTVFQAVVDEAAQLHAAHVTLSTGHSAEANGVQAVARAGHPPVDGRLLEVPVVVDDERWGVLELLSPAGDEPIDPSRPKAFSDLIAAAVANAHHREDLTQSRARVIASADEARRRLQRDVHDGAQQRLVHTIITLKLARDRAATGKDITDLLSEALTNAEDANRQLRDVVRGILPAALTRAGLAAGIQALVADTPLPASLDLDIPRLPVSVETTGYFTVAEAITNAVKHSGASHLRISGALAPDGSRLVIDIEDNGVGGADPTRGTGLTGLADRIAADRGTLAITSPANGGTRITALIPLS